MAKTPLFTGRVNFPDKASTLSCYITSSILGFDWILERPILYTIDYQYINKVYPEAAQSIVPQVHTTFQTH